MFANLFICVFSSNVERTNWNDLILHTTDLDDPVMQQVSLFIVMLHFTRKANCYRNTFYNVSPY